MDGRAIEHGEVSSRLLQLELGNWKGISWGELLASGSTQRRETSTDRVMCSVAYPKQLE